MLIRIAVVGALIALVVWLLRGGRQRSDFPCATCRHCKKLFSDGSLCAFGTSETFKNAVHIKNCMDYEPR